ncbi:DUF7736 domain-containing protein [Serratia marcescens]|uniref:DUF7736 domain-containing protein n=1 Tax=Serratia marcescens TaxID=615 RepID=UPI0018690712|nr:hypothetical protein [Serratia marcescens]
MEKLTKEQCIVITGYTGILFGQIEWFLDDAEKRLGRAILTHEMRNDEVMKSLREAYSQDFHNLMP